MEGLTALCGEWRRLSRDESPSWLLYTLGLVFISFLPSPHQEGRAGPLASCSGWSPWTYPWPDPSLLTGAGLGISDPRGTVDPGEADGEDVVGGGAALLPLTTVPVSAENTEVSWLDLPLGSSRDFRDSQWDQWEQLPQFLLLHAVLREIGVEEKGFCSEFILNLLWISPAAYLSLDWSKPWGWALLGPPLLALMEIFWPTRRFSSAACYLPTTILWRARLAVSTQEDNSLPQQQPHGSAGALQLDESSRRLRESRELHWLRTTSRRRSSVCLTVWSIWRILQSLVTHLGGNFSQISQLVEIEVLSEPKSKERSQTILMLCGSCS